MLNKALATLLLLVLSSSVIASSLSLVPTGAIINLNDMDIVTFDVVVDFTDDSGTLGGGLDIAFDSSALQFDSVTRVDTGDPDFGRDPDDLGDLLESWAIGNFATFPLVEIIGSIFIL